MSLVIPEVLTTVPCVCPPCCALVQVGSGFDVSAAVYGTHVYTRFSPSVLAGALSAGEERPSSNPTTSRASSESAPTVTPPVVSTPLERIVACVGAQGGWDADRGELRLPACFRLLMGDVCGGSSTPSMVRKVFLRPLRTVRLFFVYDIVWHCIRVFFMTYLPCVRPINAIWDHTVTSAPFFRYGGTMVGDTGSRARSTEAPPIEVYQMQYCSCVCIVKGMDDSKSL